MSPDSPMFDLTGKVALVTGAARGIGKAISDAFERQGATVFRHVREEAEASAIPGDRVLVADLADPAALQTMVASFPGDTLDALVNNAGVEHAEASTRLEAEVFLETMTVNALAPAQLIGAFADLLAVGSGGSVVNVTSLHATFPYPGHLAYASSKAALEMVTRTMAVELGDRNIRVNSLCPGIIETDINRAVFEKLGRESLVSLVPAARVGSVDDLTGPAVFLVSDASRYVNGATLVVDGGFAVNLARYGRDSPA